jgi:glutaminyl-peptide cyclotransferase
MVKTGPPGAYNLKMKLFGNFKKVFIRISTTLDVTESMSGRAKSRPLYKIIHVFALASLLMPLGSCDNTSNDKPVVPVKQTAPTAAHITPPDFNSDSAFSFIKVQADMGPRTPGSKAHETAVNYFEKKFKSYGAEVVVQKATVTTFDDKKWLCKNVIASFNPNNPTRILLSAHWDSRPFCDGDSIKENAKKACPGVNDGASGVGVLLEIARLISQNKINIGIDIALWDMEDYGAGQLDLPTDNGMDDDWALGSQYWSKNPHKPGYLAKYGILLDMVGGKNTAFPSESNSMFYAGAVKDKVWNTAANIGYEEYFITRKCEVMDDHVYINRLANIPCIDIIGYRKDENKFFPQHHTLRDDINTIDKNTLKAAGQTVLEVIYNETP